jgi:hypothetical protein
MDAISFGFLSLTDAAKGTTPVPNAAEADLATSRALSQNKNLPSRCGRGLGQHAKRSDRLEDFICFGSFSLTDAARGTTPVPNAAEALAATSSALSQ